MTLTSCLYTPHQPDCDKDDDDDDDENDDYDDDESDDDGDEKNDDCDENDDERPKQEVVPVAPLPVGDLTKPERSSSSPSS